MRQEARQQKKAQKKRLFSYFACVCARVGSVVLLIQVCGVRISAICCTWRTSAHTLSQSSDACAFIDLEGKKVLSALGCGVLCFGRVDCPLPCLWLSRQVKQTDRQKVITFRG